MENLTEELGMTESFLDLGNLTNLSTTFVPDVKNTTVINNLYLMIVAAMVHLTVGPVIFCIGAVCNILALAVLQRKKMNLPIHTYLSALACSDLTTLITNQTYWLTLTASQGKVSLLEFIDCNIVQPLLWIPPVISNNILVAISLERVITLYFPNKAKYLLNVKTSRKCVAIVIAYSILINWHLCGALKYDPSIRQHWCLGKTKKLQGYVNFFTAYLNPALYSFLPIVLILTFNALVISHLIKSKKRVGNAENSNEGKTATGMSSKDIKLVKPLPNGSETTSEKTEQSSSLPVSGDLSNAERDAAEKSSPKPSQFNPNQDLKIPTSSNSWTRASQNSSSTPSDTIETNVTTLRETGKDSMSKERLSAHSLTQLHNIQGKRVKGTNVPQSTQPRSWRSKIKEKRDRTSLIIIAVCLTHVVLLIPPFIPLLLKRTSENTALFTLMNHIFGMCLYLNHSINPIIYCTVARQFRDEVKALFQSCCSRG